MSWEREQGSWPNRESSRFVQAAGIRWHVQQSGSGPVLLLVHGTGASTHSWRDLLPILAEQYTVIAMDLPGHGFTGRVDAARSSMDGMSESLAALLGVLQADPVQCAGHSAGAAILCRMALDGRIAPRSIASINGAFFPLYGAASVFFSPIAKLLNATPLVPRLLARFGEDPARVRRLLDGTGSRLDAAGEDLYARLVRDPNHIAGALAMMGNWDLHAFERRLPDLKTPLTLIAADNDRTVVPQQALRVRELLPAATLIRLPGLGHLAHEEAPAAVSRLLLDSFGAH